MKIFFAFLLLITSMLMWSMEKSTSTPIEYSPSQLEKGQLSFSKDLRSTIKQIVYSAAQLESKLDFQSTPFSTPITMCAIIATAIIMRVLMPGAE